MKKVYCKNCKYYSPGQGTGDGCLKALHRWNPFKKTIWFTDRVDENKKYHNCFYYKRDKRKI